MSSKWLKMSLKLGLVLFSRNCFQIFIVLVTVPVFTKVFQLIKGIVSRDFEWLQTILMNRLCVPDVPLEVYSFLNLHLHIVFNF